MLTTNNGSFGGFVNRLKSKNVDKLKNFKGTIDLENNLNILDVLSRVSGKVLFSKSDRMSAAYVRLKNNDYGLYLVKNGAENQNYLKLKRMIEDSNHSIDCIMFVKSHLIANIYENVFENIKEETKNRSINSFERMLDIAIEKKTANINILYTPSAFMTITFKINKILWQFESIDAKRGLEMIKAFYRRVSETDKSNAEFDLNKTLDATFNYTTNISDRARTFNLRWISLPSVSGGHDVTIRLNEIGRALLPLDGLGYDLETLDFFDDITDKDTGLMLWVGATDSGKTTTNASFGQMMLSKTGFTKKLITVEDPVEMIIPTSHPHSIFADKSDKNPWETMIKSIKRQAPDIVFVGEIRDGVVANLCIQEVLAGHFTLSTLHANSWDDAFNRLIIEMKVDAHTLCMQSVLRGIVAQRLVPVSCPDCSLEYKDAIDGFDKKYLIKINEYFTGNDLDKLRFINNSGECETCQDTKGVSGIQPIYEIYKPHSDITQHLIDKDFIGARKAWLNLARTDDNVNGITYFDRAVKLAYLGKLCPLWIVKKLVD